MRNKSTYAIAAGRQTTQDIACHEGKYFTTEQSLRVIIAFTGLALSSCATEFQTAMTPSTSKTWKEIAPSELKIAPARSEATAPRQKESAQPPTDPSSNAARTPEEGATARAADPKDSSGVGIIKVPVLGTGK